MLVQLFFAFLSSGQALTVKDDEPWSKVKIFTFDTRQGREIHREGLNITNAGFGKEWKRMKTKTCGIAEFIQGLADEGSTEYVLFVDGLDVHWGGCSEKELLNRYRSLVKASGAHVIYGAEASLFPQSKHQFEMYEGLVGKRAKIMQDLGINETQADSFVNCDYAHRKATDFPCNTYPGRARMYLNSGFFLGPPKDIAPIYERACAEMSWGASSEQRVLHPIFLELANKKIALDYTGRLVENMHNVKKEAYDELFRVRKVGHKTVIRNAATGERQCFVHGNGNGIKFILNKVLHNVPREDSKHH